MAHGAPDYSGMKVDVVLRPEWATEEAIDKTFEFSVTALGVGLASGGSYAVPAGKTLRITSYSFSIYGNAAADRELSQHGALSVTDNTVFAILAHQGGDGGGGSSLPTPAIIPAGHTMAYTIANQSNHAVAGTGIVKGYEV